MGGFPGSSFHFSSNGGGGRQEFTQMDANAMFEKMFGGAGGLFGSGGVGGGGGGGGSRRGGDPFGEAMNIDDMMGGMSGMGGMPGTLKRLRITRKLRDGRTAEKINEVNVKAGWKAGLKFDIQGWEMKIEMENRARYANLSLTHLDGRTVSFKLPSISPSGVSLSNPDKKLSSPVKVCRSLVKALLKLKATSKIQIQVTFPSHLNASQIQDARRLFGPGT
ncbi:hypothetical protein KEM48_002774 [Puccinia striiformis f. sp. tritici PST-130]|nr:hypothetical protein KEM48_002774 [Puccinia striiformis f. sp. tritici PST-130]